MLDFAKLDFSLQNHILISKTLIFYQLGGAGGDGGKGQKGVSSLDKIPRRPTTAKEVYDRGVPADNPHHHESHKKECCCVWDVCLDSCTANTDYYYRVLDIKTDSKTCGGKGGNGGNGGHGGAAGGVTIISMGGNTDLEALIKAQDSNGGFPGIGGIGGDGLIANSRYTGYYKTWDKTECDTFIVDCDAKCDSGPYAYEGYGANTSQDEFCPGDQGDLGNPGEPWTDAK